MEPILSYFPHKVNSRGHWKFKALRKKYGFEGEGRFWVLNCIIAEEENCRLDLTRRAKLVGIATELDMEPEPFSEYLKFLVTDVELVKKDKAGYYTDRVDEIFDSVINRRNRQKKYYDKKKGAKPTEDDHKLQSKRPKTSYARHFYREQFDIARGQALQSKYFHFVAYLFNEPGHENVIKESGDHILNLKKQITFDEYVKLFEVCKARNLSPINMVDSWLNNKAYSKGKVSVYATLRSWANKETVKQTNL